MGGYLCVCVGGCGVLWELCVLNDENGELTENEEEDGVILLLSSTYQT